MNINDIINRISYFRNEENLSARELSLSIDKNGAYINHLESGNFNIYVSILLEILEALEITSEEFFFDDFRNYKQDKEILDLLKKLSPEVKDAHLLLMKNSK